MRVGEIFLERYVVYLLGVKRIEWPFLGLSMHTNGGCSYCMNVSQGKKRENPLLGI